MTIDTLLFEHELLCCLRNIARNIAQYVEYSTSVIWLELTLVPRVTSEISKR